MSTVAEVRLWGSSIGAVSVNGPGEIATFEYTAAFRRSGIEVAPLMMPLAGQMYSFPDLRKESFHGLPGMLADALPDTFGNAVIDAWLASQGRLPQDIDAVERLCYTGTCGIGALEFKPAHGPQSRTSTVLKVDSLVTLASEVLSNRENLQASFADPQEFGAIEYAYSLMAKAAGIRMSECRLFEENGRRHFMTRRFDRLDDGEKLHMQSLGAIAHLDFNNPIAHSYEQAVTVIRRLGLSMDAVEEQFRRMVFNVIARNQDDHVKNIAFLMDKRGQWALAPAFDVMYAYNPSGTWTASHQMSLAGKREGFTLEDLKAVADTASMKRGRAEVIARQVAKAVSGWREFAAMAGVASKQIDMIADVHRLDLV